MSYKGGKKSNVYEAEEGYDLYADSYDEDLRFLDSFEKDVFLRLIGDLHGKKVLDVGCGTGRIIPSLKRLGGDVVAADLSNEMLKIVHKAFPDIETLHADIENLPFEENSFDVVTAMFVVVHLKDLRRAFEEVYRILKPGGYFILSNINQRKAPKIKLKTGEEIVIKSYYHIPRHLIEALEESFFKIEKEKFIYEKNTWINQVVKAVK